LEEDAGKSITTVIPGATPLTSIGLRSTHRDRERPDIRISAGAGAYLRTLKQILQYLDVSDVSMEEGVSVFDANISVLRPGNRSRNQAEVKNMNSFSAVERALEAESKAVCAGSIPRKVEQQTLLWDGARETVHEQNEGRNHDYRYFPNRSPSLIVDEKWISVRGRIFRIAGGRKKRLVEE